MTLSFQELGNIQRTMLIPLFARAKESKHPKPMVRDPMAAKILAELKVDIAPFEKEPVVLQVVACVAATIFDRLTKRFLEEHPRGVIVEIGPGLDTRYERIDNGQARWVDIDMPDAIQIRQRFFPETDRRQLVGCSILEDGWVERVKELNPSALLFVAEGVLFYFTEDEVKGLYRRIADHFPGALFAHDSCVRGVAEKSDNFRVCQIGGARFRWGIDDIHEVESWDSRYQVLEVDTVLNHYRHRYPWVVRLATWLIPKMRHVFTINLVRLG